MKDRTVRRLTALQKTGSSARTLNLAAIDHVYGHLPELAEAPFFRHPALNRAIIVKHRLRPHELDIFGSRRSQATKVLIPIDHRDLKLGAHYFFVGQMNFEEVVRNAFGDALKIGKDDRTVLDLLNALPSLDPFLLREQLKRHGYEPARIYFNISEGDLKRMFAFVQTEVAKLVMLSFNSEESAHSHSAKLVSKLLSPTPDLDFGPLRETLKLENEEYLDGLFAWRGFLYYKWVLSHLERDVTRVIFAIDQIRPRGSRGYEAVTYVLGARDRIQSAIQEAWMSVRAILNIYDEAYMALTRDGQPQTFREFLLTAPRMFRRLGEQLGAIQHIVTYWDYSFPVRRPMADADELMDIFLDFEDSLVCAKEPGVGVAA